MMEQVMISKTPRCKNCGSTLTYIKLRERIRVCRQCGYEEKLNKEDDK